MNVKISKSETKGSVVIPSSKSVAHRVLIATFLSGGNAEVSGNLKAGDVIATFNCLCNLGAKMQINDEKSLISVNGREEIKTASIDVRDSGSTLRFLLPVIATLGIKCKVCGTKRLSDRPIGELLSVLAQHGAEFLNHSLPLETGGSITGGDYVIDAGVSSQFITGLLLALPVLKSDSRIILKNEMVSSGYVDVTIRVLKKYGIKIEKTDYGFFVRGGQKYREIKNIAVEGDWSSACFMACLGAINGEITLKGLDLNSAQGDKIVVDVLEKIGADVRFDEDGSLTVRKSELNAIKFDAENYPDIVPVLSAALAFCNGVSEISGVERLRLKESDRISEIIRLHSEFGIKAEYSDGVLKIYGGKPKACLYRSPDDHRLAMSAAVMASCIQGESKITGAECVNKSYPDFFDQLKQSGGNVDVQSL